VTVDGEGKGWGKRGAEHAHIHHLRHKVKKETHAGQGKAETPTGFESKDERKSQARNQPPVEYGAPAPAAVSTDPDYAGPTRNTNKTLRNTKRHCKLQGPNLGLNAPQDPASENRRQFFESKRGGVTDTPGPS